MTDWLGSLARDWGVQERPGDYWQDGLLFCGQCHTARQGKTAMPDGKDFAHPALCECRKKARDKEEADRAERERLERVDHLRRNAFCGRGMRDYTFANDNGENQKRLAAAKRYVGAWPEIRSQNIGLLLHGDVGAGKTYFAASVVNALIDQCVPALMTSFPALINAMWNTGKTDRNGYIQSVVGYPLLVIDDLGAERQSEYAQEIVYNVVNERYAAKKPLIVTTNMDIGYIRNPDSITEKRIYDRILEMCAPMAFRGESMRGAAAKGKAALLGEILKGFGEA